MNMHMLYIKDLNHDPQKLFEDVVSHTVHEDSRGYQTLIAIIIKNILHTDWMPNTKSFHSADLERRAGYLIEFAARKMVDNREKKITLFRQIETLRHSTLNSLYTTILPNMSGYEYAMDRNTDELSREWGLLDGLCRANILKMIKED